MIGDFRQTLPVIPRGTPADEIDACLKSSYLWKHASVLKLTTNMRAKLLGHESDSFASTLIKLGDGTLPTDQDGFVNVEDIGNKCESLKSLSEQVYPQLSENFRKYEWLTDRAILSPTNASVNEVNYDLLKKLPGKINCLHTEVCFILFIPHYNS